MTLTLMFILAADPADVARGLKDAHSRGAALYNAGDPQGCYRLMEGAVRAAKPSLAARPGLVKMIDAGLARAGAEPAAWKRAFAMHRLIGRIIKGIDKPPAAKAAPPKRTLVIYRGEPVVDVVLGLVSAGPDLRIHSTRTDADGRFGWGAIPAGEYTLIVRGGSVPARYRLSSTSPLRLKIGVGRGRPAVLALKD